MMPTNLVFLTPKVLGIVLKKMVSEALSRISNGRISTHIHRKYCKESSHTCQEKKDIVLSDKGRKTADSTQQKATIPILRKGILRRF